MVARRRGEAEMPRQVRWLSAGPMVFRGTRERVSELLEARPGTLARRASVEPQGRKPRRAPDPGEPDDGPGDADEGPRAGGSFAAVPQPLHGQRDRKAAPTREARRHSGGRWRHRPPFAFPGATGSDPRRGTRIGPATAPLPPPEDRSRARGRCTQCAANRLSRRPRARRRAATRRTPRNTGRPPGPRSAAARRGRRTRPASPP